MRAARRSRDRAAAQALLEAAKGTGAAPGGDARRKPSAAVSGRPRAGADGARPRRLGLLRASNGATAKRGGGRAASDASAVKAPKKIKAPVTAPKGTAASAAKPAKNARKHAESQPKGSSQAASAKPKIKVPELGSRGQGGKRPAKNTGRPAGGAESGRPGTSKRPAKGLVAPGPGPGIQKPAGQRPGPAAERRLGRMIRKVAAAQQRATVRLGESLIGAQERAQTGHETAAERIGRAWARWRASEAGEWAGRTCRHSAAVRQAARAKRSPAAAARAARAAVLSLPGPVIPPTTSSTGRAARRAGHWIGRRLRLVISPLLARAGAHARVAGARTARRIREAGGRLMQSGRRLLAAVLGREAPKITVTATDLRRPTRFIATTVNRPAITAGPITTPTTHDPIDITGGTTMSNFAQGLRDHAEGLIAMTQQYQPESMTEYGQALQALPGVLAAVAEAVAAFPASPDRELPVDPAVADAVQEISAALHGISRQAEDIHGVFRAVHETELARLETPRPGEELWDIRANRDAA